MDTFMLNMEGRIGRRRYLALWGLFYVFIGTSIAIHVAGRMNDMGMLIGIGQAAFVVTLLVGTFGMVDATGKRLHDLGKSGWFSLILFVPLLNLLLVAILLCTAGNAGPNRYGPDPRYDQAPQALAAPRTQRYDSAP